MTRSRSCPGRGAGRVPRFALRAGAAAGAVAATWILSAAPAGASLTGPCSASGTIGGRTYDPKVVDEVELPLEGDVAWTGSVPGEEGTERPISGEVTVDVPGGIGITVAGKWEKTSDTYSNQGTYHYEFPSVLEGVKIPVSGFHQEPGQPRCEGSVTVQLGDGGFGNPVAIPSLVLTALSATMLVVAVRGGA
jgi:hypothetical protein